MISKANPGDAAPIANLVNSAYRGDHAKKGWTTEAYLIDGTRTDATMLSDIMQEPGTTILKYEQDGTIIGCVELRIVLNKLYVEMLTVEPSIQGGGIGKQLLAAAENFGKEKGCRAVFMNVITVRTELIDWYKRHGYNDTGRKKPFEAKDPVLGQPKQTLEFLILEKSLE